MCGGCGPERRADHRRLGTRSRPSRGCYPECIWSAWTPRMGAARPRWNGRTSLTCRRRHPPATPWSWSKRCRGPWCGRRCLGMTSAPARPWPGAVAGDRRGPGAAARSLPQAPGGWDRRPARGEPRPAGGPADPGASGSRASRGWPAAIRRSRWLHGARGLGRGALAQRPVPPRRGRREPPPLPVRPARRGAVRALVAASPPEASFQLAAQRYVPANWTARRTRRRSTSWAVAAGIIGSGNG